MYKKRKQKKNIIYVLSILVLIIASMCYHTKDYDLTGNENNTYNFDDLNIPEWDGLSPYIEINNNIPMFSTKNINFICKFFIFIWQM